jgi:hypothetical protein
MDIDVEASGSTGFLHETWQSVATAMREAGTVELLLWVGMFVAFIAASEAIWFLSWRRRSHAGKPQ